MTTTKSTAAKELTALGARLRKLPAQLDGLAADIAKVEDRMRALKKAGLIYAAPHLRQGRYFLLVHPQKDGKRPNPTYIGTDEKKIQAAKDGIARAQEFDALTARQRELSGQVWEARGLVQDLERALTSRPR